MKHSIRKQLALIFMGVMVGVLLLGWVVNAFWLESYYTHNKCRAVEEAYQELNRGAREDLFQNEEFLGRLNTLGFTDNISMLVLDSSGYMELYTVKDAHSLQRILYAYILEKEFPDSQIRILSSTEQYLIRQRQDMKTSAEYMEMLGVLDNGDHFVLQTAMESIRDSAAIASRFYTYIGIAAILVSCVLIWFFSRQFTEPILELTEISKRMTELDFNAKFTGKQENEIAFLGNHMNQMSETLERTISELKTANNELKKDIEQKTQIDEMRKEFLSNVSHELKTPIALIQGYAEGLKECVNEDAASREFYCEVIMDEAGKMNTLVKKLLTLNQIEFGNSTVSMERFDITALLRSVLASAAILLEQNGIKTIFKQEAPLYVWSDEFLIEEVVTNYLSNAIHHCEGERIIEIRTVEKENTVRVCVFNTGTPIPEEELDKIWIKFYKVDKARTREYGGSGIGLSIVKAVMESLNQKFGAQNFSNGTEFWFEADRSDKIS